MDTPNTIFVRNSLDFAIDTVADKIIEHLVSTFFDGIYASKSTDACLADLKAGLSTLMDGLSTLRNGIDLLDMPNVK